MSPIEQYVWGLRAKGLSVDEIRRASKLAEPFICRILGVPEHSGPIGRPTGSRVESQSKARLRSWLAIHAPVSVSRAIQETGIALHHVYSLLNTEPNIGLITQGRYASIDIDECLRHLCACPELTPSALRDRMKAKGSLAGYAEVVKKFNAYRTHKEQDQ